MSNDSFYLDMHGEPIQLFDEVNVPDPKENDLHNFEFTGIVDSFRNGNVIVVDGDGDCWEFNPERLELANEE